MKGWLTFKREIGLGEVIAILGIGAVLISDHRAIKELEKDQSALEIAQRVDADNLSELAASCHRTAGEVDAIRQFVESNFGRPFPPRPRPITQ